MKNALWSVVFINLLAIGIGLGYVAVEPRKVRDVLTGKTQPADFRAMAEERAQLPTRRSAPDGPIARPTRQPGTDSADAGAAARRPPARRPPTRKEAAPTVAKAGTPIDRAEYIGPALDPITENPPAPELYPFRVDRRTFPTPETVQVEMSIQNQSGYHWQTAYVVIKSTSHPAAEVFKIDEWAIEEVIGIDYEFPRAQLYDRLKNLRIIRVSGQRRESALAETIGAKRAEIARELGTKENLTEVKDPTRPTGLLSVWVGATSAIQGSSAHQMDPALVYSGADGSAPRTGTMRIKIPDSAMISETYSFSVPPSSPERREALELLETVHQSARRAQTNLVDLADLLNKKSFRAIRTPEGEELTGAAADALKQFNEAGIGLTLLASRSNDEAIKKMAGELARMAEQLVMQTDAVESSVRLIEPEFSIVSED